MPIQTQDFTTLVRNQVAAAQAAARENSSTLIDFEVGSVLLSLIESNTAGVALWLQGLLLQVLSITRASTSEDSDLDTWMADYNFERLEAEPATGTVTFSRFTATQQAVVPANSDLSQTTKVQTADGSQTFSVIIDTSNPNYNEALGGYVLLAGTASIDVPVKADVAGSGGNVAANAINTIISPIPFVDTVTNNAAFTNGVDEESNDAFRTRFVSYLLSLVRGTLAAINFAITSVQQGVTDEIVENEQYDGTVDRGYFYAVVDDGTGNPPGDLITNIALAVDAFRACGIAFNVFPPIDVTANVTMTVIVASGYVSGTVKSTVQTALASYINSLALGETLYFTRLIQVAYDASPGVQDVTGVTLNSGISDLAATVQQIIKSGTITIN